LSHPGVLREETSALSCLPALRLATIAFYTAVLFG
jgi:hypothetical protein